MYSIEVPYSSTDTSSTIRRSYKTHLIGHSANNGSITLFEAFNRACHLYGDNECLGERAIDSLGNASPFLFKSYAEIANEVKNFASGLKKLNLISKNDQGLDMLGIYMHNCYQWIVSEQACYYLSAITVPLYDTLGPDTIEYCTNECQLNTILCNSKGMEMILNITRKTPTLKNVIVVDFNDSKRLKAISQTHQNIKIYKYEDIIRCGEAFLSPPTPPLPSTIATLCYTSGTTGNPKGAIITHGNLLSASVAGLEGSIRATSADAYLSFLPLPHIFERLVINSLISCGCKIGFFRGNTLELIDDIKALEPSIFCAVPRLLNRIYDKIMTGARSKTGMTKSIFMNALTTKLDNLHKNGNRDHWLYDRLVFTSLKKALGFTNLRIMLSGGAPLAGHVMEFFRIMLGNNCSCHEGYGQTETSGATSITAAEDIQTVGHVGAPFTCVELKLVDVNDMGYFHTDCVHGDNEPCVGRGEIYVKGTNVFQGYYKNESATFEAFDTEGWLRTGDIGMWTTLGQLKIIDRKKNIIKLAQGEFIAVEKVEGILSQSPLVGSIFVHADSKESSIVAVVVVDIDSYNSMSTDPSFKSALSSSSSNSNSNLPSLCATLDNTRSRKALEEYVLQQMDDVGRQNGLKGFEIVKAVHLVADPWLPSDDVPIVTPTLKLQRNKAKERYKTELADLYKGLSSRGRSASGISKL